MVGEKLVEISDSGGVDATSLSGSSTTKPASKDGMSSPLPWCVDRVGALVCWKGGKIYTSSGTIGCFFHHWFWRTVCWCIPSFESFPTSASATVPGNADVAIMHNNGLKPPPVLVFVHTKVNQEPITFFSKITINVSNKWFLQAVLLMNLCLLHLWSNILHLLPVQCHLILCQNHCQCQWQAVLQVVQFLNLCQCHIWSHHLHLLPIQSLLIESHPQGNNRMKSIGMLPILCIQWWWPPRSIHIIFM